MIKNNIDDYCKKSDNDIPFIRTVDAYEIYETRPNYKD